MNAALIAGTLSGAAGLLTFLIIHHFWIKPIWMILPIGLPIAGLGGLAAGWAYGELLPHLPPRPWTALVMAGLIAGILLPSIVIAQIRPPLYNFTQMAFTVTTRQAVTAFVLELVLTAVLAGGLAGWWIGQTPRAALATAAAGLVCALGPGHNIPMLGNTPVVAKGVGLLAAIILVSAIVLVETQFLLSRGK